MRNAALLRDQINHALSERIPAALSPRLRTALEHTPCGIPAIDGLLHGGLPAGVLTEFTGEEGSGRTTIALACLAATTQTGKVAAWIDASDALDPESVAANGVDLERLLWVRCGSSQKPSPQATPEPPLQTSSIPAAAPARHTGGGSPHPRSEGRDMPQAIGALLHAQTNQDQHSRRQKRSVGTPGAPNRPFSRSQDREEQVNSDRLPPRRGENLAIAPRCAEPQPRRIASLLAADRLAQPGRPGTGSNSNSNSNAAKNTWQALDQALRTTDLILQGGGFSVVVLDLGSTPAEFTWRIPLATWFRFRAACERTRVSLVLLTQHPCARSSAEFVVRLHPGSMEAAGNIMTGIRFAAEPDRSRSHEDQDDAKCNPIPIRKPPQSERFAGQPGQWRTPASWIPASWGPAASVRA